MTKFPAYYVMETLVGGGDINRRTIYNSKHNPVCVLNQEMRQWSCEDERLLSIVLRALIEDAAPQDTKDNIEDCSKCFGTGRFQGKFGGPGWPTCPNCDGRGKLLIE